MKPAEGKKRDRQPSNRIAMLLSLLPGAGHYYLERYIMSSLLFGAFITSLNGLFLGSTLQSGNPETLKGVAMAGLVIVWLLSILLTYKQSYGTDRKSLAQNRGILLRAALVDYLRDDLEDSAKKLEQAIEMDVDWQDPDPLFHLGVVMLRLAERSAARALKESARSARRRSQWAFRTCLARDRDKKWRSEIARESKRMRRILSITGRLRAVSSGSDRLTPISDSGSFPELQASGSFERLKRPGESGEGKLRSGAIVRGLSSGATPSEGLPRAALSELGAELEAPVQRTPSKAIKRSDVQEEAKKKKSSPYLPPPTRTYARPDPVELARMAQMETVSLEGGKADLPEPVADPKPEGEEAASAGRKIPPTAGHSRLDVELEAEVEPAASSESGHHPLVDDPGEEPASAKYSGSKWAPPPTRPFSHSASLEMRAEAKADPEPETETETETETESETETETETETESETETETETETEAEAEAETEAETEAESEIETLPKEEPVGPEAETV